jgi:signal transduction histidine kinase/ActR/RegA family two-component response regulator
MVSRTDASRWFALMSLGAGAFYPAFWWVTPAGARDPLWPWVAIGCLYVVCSLLAIKRVHFAPVVWLSIPQFASTLQLHVLFAMNPQEPFYAAAGLLQIFSSLLFLQNLAPVFAYAWFALALSVVPVVAGGRRLGFYLAGVASLVFLANNSIRRAWTERRRSRDDLASTRAELAHERSERQRLENELRTAQRMDALGRLAGAFAHEFNNQLMAIRIHTELLEKSIPSGAPQRADIDQIHNTTSAAADLTARLLTFSRPSREQEDPADVPAIVRQNLVTLRHLMTEHVPLSWRLPDRVHRAPVGAKQLSQVLLNLALNAKEAMSGSGTLRIEVTRIARGSALLPAAITGETLIVLTVSDTGPGMDEETRERIFEPFFTTKADRGNSGLGLSVVYGIVRETGGHIRVTSEPGRGARFDIYWPEVGEVAAATELAAESTPEARPKRVRVLLVEDQAVLRVGLTRWLADSGYTVVACESGEEALTRANDVDVIASDVVLRGMDGIELLGRIRRAAPRLPAVLFSGHLDHLARERRAIPPGVTFLEKPFAPEALVSKLDELVDAARATPVH